MKATTNRVGVLEADVVVVGAGAAGLQCANLLLDRLPPALAAETSPSVLVLEAKDRTGGRINSMKEKLSEDDDGFFVWEEGAAWIHGLGCDAWPASGSTSGEPTKTTARIQNPMVELLQQHYGGFDEMVSNINPVFLHGNPWIRPKHVLHSTGNLTIFMDGEVLPEETALAGLKLHFDRLHQVSKLKGSCQYSNLQAALDDLDGTEGSVSYRLADFYVHLMELWYGAPAARIPLSDFIACDVDEETTGETDAWSDATYTNEGDFEGPHCTVREGMRTVLQPLLCNVVDCIRLQEPVTSIRETSSSAICVETDTGLTVNCRACVVTVSVGVLQARMDDLFHPPLSSSTQSMIRSMYMGRYKKVLLEFTMSHAPPWPTDCKFLGVVVGQETMLPTNRLKFSNVYSASKQDTYFLEVILVHSVAKWASGRSEKEIQEAVLEFLQLGMGVDPGTCTGCRHVSRWEEDEFTRGAYSLWQEGDQEASTSWDEVKDYGGKLVWAGEATVEEYEGSVHAALLSGRRAAEQVLEFLAG